VYVRKFLAPERQNGAIGNALNLPGTARWIEGEGQLMHPYVHAQVRAASGGEASHDPGTLQPLTAPLARASLVPGLSRSAIYRAAAEGKIVLLKAGRTTLVDMESVRAFLAGLPRAELRRRGRTRAQTTA
jgi:hypothetical protein